MAWPCGITRAKKNKIWAVRLKVPGPRFGFGDGQRICDIPLSHVISTGFGVEVKRVTGFTKSDSEPGDWTWAACWLTALRVLCQ